MAEIMSPGVNAVVLERARPSMTETLRYLTSVKWSPLQMVFEAGDDLDLIAAEIDFHLDLPTKDATVFYSDLSWIVQGYLSATRSRLIGLRLETVDFDNCQNFHVDKVHLRLVTTYAGAATEWLENEDVIRGGLGQRDNSQVARVGGRVRAFATGWVAIMKGENFPGNRGNGFVHRSPSILGKGERRILLRIDTLDDESFR